MSSTWVSFFFFPLSSFPFPPPETFLRPGDLRRNTMGNVEEIDSRGGSWLSLFPFCLLAQCADRERRSRKRFDVDSDRRWPETTRLPLPFRLPSAFFFFFSKIFSFAGQRPYSHGRKIERRPDRIRTAVPTITSFLLFLFPFPSAGHMYILPESSDHVAGRKGG